MVLRKSIIGLLVSANLTGCCLINDNNSFNPLKNSHENYQYNSLPNNYFLPQINEDDIFKQDYKPENPIELLPHLKILPEEKIIPKTIPQENDNFRKIIKIPNTFLVRY